MSEYRHERPRWERYLPFRRTKLRSYLVAAGVLIGLLGYNRMSWPPFAAGVVSMAFAAFLHVWAKGHLDKNRTLTRSGPYRWVRDPFHLSNFFMDFGLCLIINNWWFTAVFMTLWVIAYSYRLGEEHEMLVELFGDEYLEYKARIPRMIPWRRPLDREKYDKPFSVRHAPIWQGKVCTRLFRLASYPYVLFAAAALGARGIAWPGPAESPAFYWALCGALFFHVMGEAAARVTTRRASPLPRALIGEAPLAVFSLAFLVLLYLVDTAALPLALPQWRPQTSTAVLALAVLLALATFELFNRSGRDYRFHRLVDGGWLSLLALATPLPWLLLLPALWFACAFLYGAPSRAGAPVEQVFNAGADTRPGWHPFWLVLAGIAGLPLMLA